MQKNLRHSSTLKVDVGILEIRNNDGIEETNCCIFGQKNLPLSWKLKKNHRICRWVYQSLNIDIADTFVQYIHPFEPGEIQQLDHDIKANGWEIASIVYIQNYTVPLQCFEFFDYFNGHLPLTNGLLPVPGGETHPSAEKIALKRLYELYRGTKSHGLVWLKFLSTLNLLFGGDIQNPRRSNQAISTLNLWKYKWKIDMPITADTIDDDLFSNTDIKEQHKQNINNILQQVNHGDIHIAQPTVEIKGEKDRLKPAKKKKRKILWHLVTKKIKEIFA